MAGNFIAVSSGIPPFTIRADKKFVMNGYVSFWPLIVVRVGGKLVPEAKLVVWAKCWFQSPQTFENPA